MNGKLRIGIFAAASLGIVGLYRLRGWALLWNLVANIAVATAVLTKVIWVPQFIGYALVTTATVQSILPIFLWHAVCTGRTPKMRPHPGLALSAVLALMTAAALSLTR